MGQNDSVNFKTYFNNNLVILLLSMLNVPHAPLIILMMFTIVVKQGRAAPKQIFHVDSVCGCSMWFSLFVNIHSLQKLLEKF